LDVARRRVASGSTIADTAFGPIQYTSEGDGPPALMIHGAGGGYDQGHWGFRDALGDVHYRVIVPSRFGYLGTPVLGDGSPAAQADAHAALLDSLGVDRVAIVAASAGALSAMQFAIRHPERTAALVLLVPDAWVPPSDAPAEKVASSPFVLNVVLKSDFVMWAFMKIAPQVMQEFVGVPKDLQAIMTSEQRGRVDELIALIQPVSQRQGGIVNDAANSNSLVRYPLEDVRAPTLIIDAKDIGTFPGSRYTAANIPGAKLVAYESGGHLLIGHEQEARDAVVDFLRANASAAAVQPLRV
jgi:pimeloyl-ACP methyl ester carboxylesterase